MTVRLVRADSDDAEQNWVDVSTGEPSSVAAEAGVAASVAEQQSTQIACDDYDTPHAAAQAEPGGDPGEKSRGMSRVHCVPSAAAGAC